MIHIFPCLADNYGFLLHEPKSGLTACIDTPDGEEIIRQCDTHGYTLTHIFNTHHHYDHVGGNEMLKEKYRLTIIGPKADEERIPGIDIAVSDGETFAFGEYEIQVIDTPGHTKGHCAYYVPAENSVFVGDTMFAMGCGRLFEGTPAQMYDSLAKLAALPGDTQIYCAHEYTLSNGLFAITAEPDNDALATRLQTVKAMRDRGAMTVPTTIAQEKATNPFVRAASPDILGKIRAAKDAF